MTRPTHAEVTEAIDLRHWRVVHQRLHACFRTGSFTRGVELVQRISQTAEHLGHHPEVHLTSGSVLVTTVSHDVGLLTDRDITLAAAVSALADDLGLTADVAAPQTMEVAIDALDIAAVVPFWRAVLAYVDERVDVEDPSPGLVDPRGTGPAVWFQQMDAERPQRNRVHLDVSVPHDIAEQRVREAIEAGGRLLSDARAPAFWVLADAEGNEACVCTWEARE